MNGSSFVGRQSELNKLNAFLDKALSGAAQVCFVTGEVGVGKTTLAYEFIRQTKERHPYAVVAIGSCNAQTGAGDPYLPFMEILSKLMAAGKAVKNDAPKNHSSRFKEFFGITAKSLVKYGPDLIGSFIPGSSLVAKVGMEMAKEAGLVALLDKLRDTKLSADLDAQKIFKQYADFLSALSRRNPLILVIDDLQWADNASINLLFHLSMKLKKSNVLLMGTYRPNDLAQGQGDDRHPMMPVMNELKRYYGDICIDMDAIPKREKMDLVAMLLDATPNGLGEDFRQRIFNHTNGHPLFVRELLNSFKESGSLIRDAEGRWVQAEALDWSVLPPRVEGVIEERVGRLEEKMREILNVASIEGEYFTVQVVAQLQQMGERELLKYLSQELEKRHRLIKEGGTEKIGKSWVSQFFFSNRLFQQYLYNDLSGREKMILHEEIAGILEELYREQREKILLQLARHYEMAGNAEKAAACYIQASARAIRIGAYDEARKQLLKALELNETLPGGGKRDRMELDLQLALSAVYKATLGWDSPEVKTAYYRARELGNQLNLPAQLAPVTFGLWAMNLVQLELREALKMAQEHLVLAEKLAGGSMLLHAYVALGNTHYWMGNIQRAYEAMETAFQMYDPEQDYILEFGQDPRILALTFMGFSSWLQGKADQARSYQKQMLSIAESLSHHFNMAIALYGSATLHYHLKDIEAMRPQVEKLVQLAQEHHFPLYLGLGLVYRGWIKVMEGKVAEGLPEIEEGFEQWVCKHGGNVTHSLYCVMLAEALQRAGQWEKGLAIVEKGLAVIYQCSEHCYESELHRLKGELLFEFAEGRNDEIETACKKAIEVSRAQEQKILELRGSMSLSRFLAREGRKTEAFELLNRISGDIAEGLDTPDLLEAKQLLDSLSAG